MRVELKVDKKYLMVPVSTKEELTNVLVHANGELLFDLNLRLSDKPNLLTWVDATPFLNKTLVFTCNGQEKCAAMYLSDELPSDLYNEELRPIIHYSPACGWVNDPNGLVYHNGMYHLFYQHNPFDTMWENMHWGHAVSRNLVNFKEMGEALFPDMDGTMFSGCAVSDVENVSGFGAVGKTPLVLFYTSAGGANTVSRGRGFTVCIAYSLDDGNTFVKYSANPVLSTYVNGNRDPKIFYHKDTQRYVMVIYLDKNDFAIYSSANLINWRYESELNLPPMIEMPDLFEVPNTKKWAFLAGANFWGDGAVANYYIGSFDGKKFTVESGPHDIDYGKDFYSLQTIASMPDNRQVLIGWRTRHLTEREKYGMRFNGEFSTPCKLKCVKAGGKVRLGRFPVEEFIEHRAKENLQFNVKEMKNPIEFSADAFSLDVTLQMDKEAQIEFNLGGNKFLYSGETEKLTCFNKEISIPLKNGKLKLYIIEDKTSVEIYAQDGDYPISGYHEPRKGANIISVNRGVVSIKAHVKVRESIYKF